MQLTRIDPTAPNVTGVLSFTDPADEAAAWFGGFGLVESGIAEVHERRPADGDPAYAGALPRCGAVARRP